MEVTKMAWMSDEQYELMQDTREKKSTARSAFNTRSHCGKSGCNFSYEKLGKKELAAMNGEVKSFRMNDPMTWEEFKDLPDDLKVIYVKALRKKYNVTDGALAEMFGVHRSLLYRWFRTLNLLGGDDAKGNRKWDKEGFTAWVNGVKAAVEPSETPIEEDEQIQIESVPIQEVFDEEMSEKIEKLCEEVMQTINDELCGSTGETKVLVPVQGSMVFEGNIDDILRSVSTLLNGKNVHLKVEWDLLEG
jgi:DNA-binding transcriptional regulator YiaG